jgi:glycosyltransferase involved in cell wall biosynthesis
MIRTGSDDTRPRFLLYSPYAHLTETHERTPWFMFCRSFSALGFRPTLLCGRLDANAAPEGVEAVETGIVASRFAPRRFLEAVLDPILAFAQIWKRTPDIVVISPLGPPIVTSLPLLALYRWLPGSARRRRTRFVLKVDANLRNYGLGPGLSRVMDMILVAATRVFDRVTVETFCSLERARSLPGARPGAFFRLPNGYPQGAVTPQPYDRVPPREPRILCVGRIVPYKGQEVLLRAFEGLASEFPEWSVRILGDRLDPAFAARLEERAARPALTGRVVLLGFRSWPELKAEYDRAAIFCLPTLHESEGNVKYEATMLGAPVVTTDVPCAADAREAGWRVARAGDPVELGQHLRELMGDENLRRAAVSDSQARIRSYLDRCRELLAAVGGPPS